MSSPVILVTGANRGIGFAIVQSTALRVPTATYILACRSNDSGKRAISELKELSVTATLDVLTLEVTDDASILAAKEIVENKYGRLDVLVNNAGMAIVQKNQDDLADLRHSFNTTFNGNITSLAAVTNAFLPLLRLSTQPRVVHISSGRASLTRFTQGNLPPTAVVAYSVSKVGLNALTIEQQKQENSRKEGMKVYFYAVNPGHCKTAFNGWKGAKDPLDGAEVVVQLVLGKRGTWAPGSFLEFEEGQMRTVPW